MRFFTPNLIDAVGVNFSESSEASSALASSNVAHEHKTKVWRTGTSTATEQVTFDLLISPAATAAVIFAHNLTASDATIQLRRSTDNFAASDLLVATFTYSTGPMLVLFSSVSARYWRVAFTKSAAAQTRDIGRIFLGTYTDLDNVIAFDGLNIKRTDLSQKSRTAGGQTYTDQRSQYRTLELSLDAISTAQKDALKAITDTVGTHQSFFFQVDPAATTEVAEVFYVKIRELPDAKVTGLSTDLVYDSKLELEEQL